jgi:hypothetical protein
LLYPSDYKPVGNEMQNLPLAVAGLILQVSATSKALYIISLSLLLTLTPNPEHNKVSPLTGFAVLPSLNPKPG